jgi:hypothetical protein
MENFILSEEKSKTRGNDGASEESSEVKEVKRESAAKLLYQLHTKSNKNLASEELQPSLV